MAGFAQGARRTGVSPQPATVASRRRRALDREQLLRPLDAFERIAPDRDEAGALGRERRVREGRGDEHVLLDRAAERGDAARLVHGRADDREIEALPAADVAVEDLADM